MSNQFTHSYALLIGVGKHAYSRWSLPLRVDSDILQCV